MPLAPRLVGLALLLLLAAAAAAPPRQDDPAAIAGAGPSAVLRFEIVDELGALMPGRLTFVGPEGGIPEIFPETQARPDDLAVRKNVVYTLSGRGAITVPPGTWTVYASRGLEWSLATQELVFEAGGEHTWRAQLALEVDSAGWISGDFHLHTLTHSGHGDSNLKERVISMIGEGVELAVATDHNHNTDYQPTIDELAAGRHVTAVTGNEVSTPIGHFNAFPLEPDRPVPDPGATDANALFRIIRAEPNRFGVTPLIQVNHPRWREIDYFTLAELDPVTGERGSTAWSADFDTLEVFNANAGWGYYDADVEQDFSVGSGVHWALGDWFNLLNRGFRYFAVGNSDSHTVHHEFAGYPRNYVASSTDDPAAIDPAEIAEAVRAGRVYTTIGPLLEFLVNSQPMGSMVQTVQGNVVFYLRLQSASWVQIDRVKVIVNGVMMSELEPQETVDEETGERWLGVKGNLPLDRDSWVCALVEGDRPLDPIVTGAERPILPLAVTNPVWVDADGDGQWTSPWDQARAAVLEYNPRLLRLKAIRRRPNEEVGRVLLAAAVEGVPHASALAREGLSKAPRTLVLSAARAAELLADEELLPDVMRALRAARDPYVAVALLRAASACGSAEIGASFLATLEHFGAERLTRYGEELLRVLPGEPVTAWLTIGYFGHPEGGPLLDREFGPESDPDPAATHSGKSGTNLHWADARARSRLPTAAWKRGFLDLHGLEPTSSNPVISENAVAYALTWLHAPTEREVVWALGTDDGCRVWLNGEVVHEDRGRHGASPLQHLVRVRLRAGWNRVLFKVENGSGGFGLYFRVLDPEVRAATAPE